MHYGIHKSHFGFFGIVFDIDTKKVHRIILPNTITNVKKAIQTHFPSAKVDSKGVHEFVDMIIQYFEGERILIPWDFVNTSICSSFQLKVLDVERSIPRGKTASYSWVARHVGTKGVRAVGSALARNTFPIVVPCHRAVRLSRHIGMYQGGPSMKRQLLEMEGVEFDESGRVKQEHFLK